MSACLTAHPLVEHGSKARGLLEETLAIWGVSLDGLRHRRGARERDYGSLALTMWLAGSGVKLRYVHGATNEFGRRAVAERMHVHDLHATILHLRDLDHKRLTYRYSQRGFRLTDVSGQVARQVIA